MTDPVPRDAPAPPVVFHRRSAAVADLLPALREALAGWVRTLGLHADQEDDVVLAGYEAMANSAEHAYHAVEPGLVDVRAEASADRVTVTVTDYGAWRPPTPTGGLRGRGLRLIDTLADRSTQEHGPGGTVVTMTWLANGKPAG